MSSRGANRERKVRKQLEDDGWLIVRATGSLGCADLVALKAGEPTMLVEVKSTAGGPYEHFRPEDRSDLAGRAQQAGAEAWLAWWPPRKPLRWIAEKDWPVVGS